MPYAALCDGFPAASVGFPQGYRKRQHRRGYSHPIKLLSILKDLAESHQGTQNEIETQIEWVERHAPEFFSYLFKGDSPRMELGRFSQLLFDGRIMRLASAVSDPTFFGEGRGVNARTRNAFSAPSRLTHIIEESSYRLSWTERLQRNQERPKKHQTKKSRGGKAVPNDGK